MAAGLAERCEVELAYAIGVSRPLSIMVETFGTETVPVETIESAVTSTFDLRPGAIIRDLDLRRPIFEKPLHMVISVGRTRTLPGKRPIESMSCAPHAVFR